MLALVKITQAKGEAGKMDNSNNIEAELSIKTREQVEIQEGNHNQL